METAKSWRRWSRPIIIILYFQAFSLLVCLRENIIIRFRLKARRFSSLLPNYATYNCSFRYFALISSFETEPVIFHFNGFGCLNKEKKRKVKLRHQTKHFSITLSWYNSLAYVVVKALSLLATSQLK